MTPIAFPKSVLSLGLAAGLLATVSQGATSTGYFIGIDNQQFIPSGVYAGLENPHYNRLVLLYNHGDHYHGKGIYRYQTGSPGDSPVVELNPANYFPEGTNPPIVLSTGLGLFEGTLASRFDPGAEFSNLTFDFVDALSGAAPGSEDALLFNSSGGRWNSLVGDAHVHLVLESLSAGLNIGDASSLSIGLSSPGDDYHLEAGFNPVFWVDENAAAGIYTAQFRLVDEEGLFGDSGTFEFRFQVIPEPSSALLSAAALGLGLLRRRR